MKREMKEKQRRKEKEFRDRSRKIKNLEKKVNTFDENASTAVCGGDEKGGGGGGGEEKVRDSSRQGHTKVTVVSGVTSGVTGVAGESAFTGMTGNTNMTGKSQRSSASSAGSQLTSAISLPTLSGKQKVLNFLNKTPVARPWRAIPNLDSKPPSAVGTEEIEEFEKKKQERKIEQEQRVKKQKIYLASVYDEFEKLMASEKADREKLELIRKGLEDEEKREWQDNKEWLVEMRKSTSSSSNLAKLAKDTDDEGSLSKKSSQQTSPTQNKDPAKRLLRSLSPTRLLFPCTGRRKRHPLKKEPKPYRCVVKPHTNYGVKGHDAKMDAEGYWVAPDLLEDDEQKRERQKKEIDIQWKERADRKSKEKAKDIPCWGNKTETKRYKNKLTSTYQYMSVGEGWEDEREKSHMDAEDFYKFITKRGNKGIRFL